MRFVGYIIKTLIESLRDWKILMFSIGFAPCFIFIVFMMYGTGNQSYQLALINQDGGVHGQQVIESLRKETYDDGKGKYAIHTDISVDEALKKLKTRSLDAVGVFQPDFSDQLQKAVEGSPYAGTKFKLYGDPQNQRYAITSIYLLTDLDDYVKEQTHYSQPVLLDEELIGKGSALSDFDIYVPGIIVFALLNVIFTAGTALIQEVEKGTMSRLILSRLKVWEFIGAIGVMQAVLSVLSMMIALGVAVLFGFTMKGSFTTMLILGLLSSIGVMGIALLTVSMLKSVYDLMTVGIIPYFIVMFFGGIFFPLPPIPLATIGNQVFKLNDLLPLSLSVSAFNRVLNFGAGLGDLTYELTGILLISCIYLVLGLSLFYRRHMRLG